jgi:NAD+ synthase (glutamine-hydrolysing)
MACGQVFEESTFIVDTDTTSLFGFPSDEGDISQIYKSLVLGLRDYRTKTGTFDSGVVIGLSGGIDSAITAVLATAAFGPEKVMCIGMPSEFSSQGSIDDAKTLAKNLGVSFEIIPIHEPYEAFLKALRPLFDDLPFDIAEENIQARCRGLILMAISNKFNRLLLATGNKSEMAVGYSTLYGDMAGGLSVISDVYKTEVYRIAEWINRDKEIIPRNIITKEPSAELRENQRDTDSLPPYQTVLDPILKLYIDQNKGKEQIIREGFDKEIVEQICGMVDRNEFKRRQAAPGLKVTSKAFGMGRRMPIAAKF